MNKFYCFALCLIGFMLLWSCHDDDAVASSWSITTIPEETVFDSYARYYNLTVTQVGEKDTELLISSNAGWLRFTRDTLAHDGILEFYAEANEDYRSRLAEIVITSATHPGRNAVVTIEQRGLGDYDDNANDPDPLSDFRVGWGFNAFDEYKSLNSQRLKIIDVDRLAAFDSDTTFNSVQEVVRGREEFSYHSAYSLQEMSSILTREMVSETRFLGVKKTTRRYSKISTKNVSEQLYAYARLSKIVASRSIDPGAVRYIVNRKDLTSGSKLPFTAGFMQVYNQITGSSGSVRSNHIQKMLDKYGTHLIVEASVGGMIDYVVSFDKHKTNKLETSAEEQCKYVFGRLSSDSKTQNTTEQMASAINNDNSFQITGGSAATKNALTSTIKGLTSAGQLNSSQLLNWLSSIKSTSIDNAAERKNLDVIDFKFIPIWELFADTEIKNHVISTVIAMSERSDCAFTDKELGTDNYEIDLKKSDISTFESGASSTLVKVLYLKDVPVLEACQEFVPKIRSDRRVTVYYPILNGRTNIGQGVFPGDGEGNAPAFLTFSDGDVYVNPIENKGYNDVLSTVYYIHGNLYAENYGVSTQKSVSQRVQKQYLQFAGSNAKYPIVKIGSGYWTRCNISENMGFGSYKDPNNPRSTFTVRETMIDKTLYGYIFHNKAAFMTNNASVYGPKEDEIYKKRILWYVPLVEDKNNLTTYLGNNHKSLFKGQPSGFEADFVGYYTTEKSGATKKDSSYIAFKDNLSATKGEALVLSSDYKWDTSVVSGINYRYPVRLFRTPYYKYK